MIVDWLLGSVPYTTITTRCPRLSKIDLQRNLIYNWAVEISMTTCVSSHIQCTYVRFSGLIRSSSFRCKLLTNGNKGRRNEQINELCIVQR